MVEHLVRNQKVTGSTPIYSTKKRFARASFLFQFTTASSAKLTAVTSHNDTCAADEPTPGMKLPEINLTDKQKDFQHLLFTGTLGNVILLIRDFFESKSSI